MIIADSAEVITATPGCYWQRSMGACSTTSDPACRTCVVSEVKRMVDASIALYVRFGDRVGIGELISMLGSMDRVGC